MTHALHHNDDPRLALEPARVALGRVGVTASCSLQQAMSAAADIAAGALHIGRVSVWLYVDDRRAIRCDYLHQPGGPQVFAGAILRARDFPQYFSAIAVRRVVAVDDVDDDAIVEEFRAAYCTPLGISAMLDAPMYYGGEIAGIVCHEHMGTPRQWTSSECEFAAAMSETVTRLYSEAAALKAEHVLSSYQQNVERLGDLSNLGRLAAGMSHDFGSILTAIVSNASLLLETRANDVHVVSLASGILDATARAADLNSSLMALGQDHMRKPSVIDPRTLLERCQGVLRMAAGSRAELTISATDPVSWVFVDPSELERVLLNLVVNARDAMPSGGQVRVVLRESTPRRPSGQGGHFVSLEVTDTGTGMDGDTLKRMFDPFFTTKGAAGTGLGMAIVQQIVVLSGGFVEVESVPGAGSTVRVFLPAIGKSR